MTRRPVWSDVSVSENQAGCDLVELGIISYVFKVVRFGFLKCFVKISLKRRKIKD